MFKFLIVLLLFTYILDVGVLWSFNTRLTWEDVHAYFKHAPKYISFLLIGSQHWIKKIIHTSCFLLIFLSAVYFIIKPSYKKANARHMIVLSALLVLFYLMPTDFRYVHSWLYSNFFEYNSENRADVYYSNEFKKDTLSKRASIEKKSFQKNLTPGRRNIIIILVESLSMYHSNYFSGLSNMTPHLDRIAQENISFFNFYSNGFKTENALISILLGKMDFPSV